MGKRTTPPRSFNTIRQTQCEVRAKRKRTSRIVLLALCAILALLMVAGIVTLICSIADLIGNGNKGNNSGDVEYQQFTKTESGIAYGELILINKDHKYTFPSTATSELVNLRDELAKLDESVYSFSKSGKYLLNKTAVDAFNQMMLAYYEWSEGEDDIVVTTTYRDYEEQEGLNNRNPNTSTKPGYSDHHSGYCIAIKAISKTHWIYENCHEYGFVVRYPDDKSDVTGVEDYMECLRYVGIAHATYMKEQNLCMEEYVEMLKSYTDEKPLKINGADGRYYEVWYVAVDGSATVKHPTNYAYTVSGTNEGGVVVTVDRSEALEPETDTAAPTEAG